jgi:hypothetical protein
MNNAEDAEIDALLEAVLGPPPGKRERDIDELINGAIRAHNGRFAMPDDRDFYADGRETMTRESQEKLIEAILRLVDEAASPQVDESLPAVASIRRCLDLLEHEIVAYARACKCSWGKIAEGLGVSRTSAHRRFAQVEVHYRRRRKGPAL